MEATQETGNLIASDKVQGTNVYNTAGDNLGAVRLTGANGGLVAPGSAAEAVESTEGSASADTVGHRW